MRVRSFIGTQSPFKHLVFFVSFFRLCSECYLLFQVVSRVNSPPKADWNDWWLCCHLYWFLVGKKRCFFSCRGTPVFSRPSTLLSVLQKQQNVTWTEFVVQLLYWRWNSGQMRFLLPGCVIFLRDKSSSAPTASAGWSKDYVGSSCVLLFCSVYTATVWIKAGHRVPSCIIPQNKHTWPGDAYETLSHQSDKPPPL